MNYYINKIVNGPFDKTVAKLVEALKNEGFGVLTDIDVKSVMKQKLDLEFRNYRILGACNPPLAHQALATEDKIGLMLPCNVIAQELSDGRVEVAAINPLLAMEKIGNAKLTAVAEEVAARLRRVVASL